MTGKRHADSEPREHQGTILFICSGFENIGVEYLSSYMKSLGYRTELLFYPATFSGSFGIYVPLLNRCPAGFIRTLVDRAIALKPDLIAFSVFTHNYQWCCDIARRIKARTQVPIIFGGPHCTSIPEKAIRDEAIDAVIVGEGEETLADIAASIRETGAIGDQIANVVTRRDGEVIINKPRPYIRDLDRLPHPDKDLFFRKVPGFITDYMILSSRGCPFHCRYCINSIYRHHYDFEKKHVRRRSVGNVIDELKQSFRKYHIVRVNFQDDVFISDIDWLEEFTIAYRREIHKPFICYGHPLFIKERAIELIKEAGCTHIRVGVQSASPHTLRTVINRPGLPDDVLRAGEILHRHRLPFSLDHMFGFPGETIEDHEQAVSLYNRVRPNRINSYWLMVYPGTDIMRDVIAARLLNAQEAEDIERGTLVASFNYPTMSYYRDRRPLEKIQILLDLLPFLSPRLVERMVRKRIYRHLPTGASIRQILQLLNDVRTGDPRALVMLKYIIEPKLVP